MSDETLLSQADRKRIAEIVRVEVRLAVQHLFDVVERNKTIKADTGYYVVGVQRPIPESMTDDWVYEEQT